ncbi:hypothetical protein AMATHDRAFT_69093 [Amanita thiersii Skay4041]|uniref:UDENN domain-containing protein n=1 Tax=Amanita thiersii Skay4041 TaxID=703135 RepID=A0A2A9NGC8_9AGAR|nr:hypothetical protein AMATHDRAFT_69093 [Amanita thiersii Skay4041]
MGRAELKLEEPLEVDIGDYNCDDEDIQYTSYLGIPRPSASTSSFRTFTTSPALSSDDPSPCSSPRPAGSPPVSYNTPIHVPFDKASSGLLSGLFGSPSSPALARLVGANGSANKLGRSSTLSTSATLPRASQSEARLLKHRNKSEVDNLEMDPVVVEKLRRWLLGIAIVEFDLDDGPVIDGVFPPMFLLPSESENIAFSAFPDSSQFEQGTSIHSFRIREQVQQLSTEKRPTTKDGFIYGFSYFIQKKDPSSKRGYRQHSIVLLTQHQYPAFFSCISSIFGPLYEAHGLPMLESACHNISTWRDPTPGQTIEIGFLGTVFQLEIPKAIDEQQLTETSSFNEAYDPRTHILASSPPLIPPPIRLFEPSLAHLWSIWECLVLCEPILVFGSSPAQTSQAVWWLRDLLRPIPLAGDIRPYFTMQDGDHSLLVNKLPPKAGTIIGVTNPFFEKSCSHWPHVLSLGKDMAKIEPATRASPSLGSAVLAGPNSGWTTKTHKRYISKDRVLLKQLELACKGSEQAQIEASLVLRRHFCSRTRDFITPLARYLHTLIPSPAEVISARTQPGDLRMKPFNSVHFMTSLKTHGSTLPFRSSSKRTEFYERWLKTPAFGLWLAQQEQIVHVVLKESMQRA